MYLNDLTEKYFNQLLIKSVQKIRNIMNLYEIDSDQYFLAIHQLSVSLTEEFVTKFPTSDFNDVYMNFYKTIDYGIIKSELMEGY